MTHERRHNAQDGFLCLPRGIPAMAISLLLFLYLSLLPRSAAALSVSVDARTHGGQNTGVGSVNPLGNFGLQASYAAHSDYSSSYTYQGVTYSLTEAADAEAYGTDTAWNTQVWTNAQGLGVAPMAFASAEVSSSSIYNPGNSLAVADISIRNLVQARPNSPYPLLQVPIPLLIDYNLETSAPTMTSSGTPTSSTAASFSIIGPGVNYGKSIANGQSTAGTLSFVAPSGAGALLYTIGASAGVNAYWAAPLGGSGTADADPFLYIDPNWQYAPYFEVLEESALNPGQWVEVTQVWRNGPATAAPEPATMLLLGLGLMGLAGVRRKFKD